MSWANFYIADLKSGKAVQFRPRGNSMNPIIKSGQLCTVEPLKNNELSKNDVVLCKVRGNQYLHKITGIKGSQYQISNNKGFVNGWINISNIYGKLIKVEN